MSKILIGTGLALVLGVGVLLLLTTRDTSPTTMEPVSTSTADVIEGVQVIARDMSIPWDIAFLPDGNMLVTERTGDVVAIGKDGTMKEIPVPDIKHSGEGGLLGILLHPDFATNNLLYLYMSTPGTGSETQNRIVRYVYTEQTLTEEKIILGGIPGAVYHDGGRMEFGPDGFLYVTTGDATRPAIAQNLSSLGGKILRLTEDGNPAPGNPFGTAVYSYGHRNPQGLAWDAEGRLWETEHGRSGIQSGLDEVNLIEAGANYGWPNSEGDTVTNETIGPLRHSGSSDTWAPASLAFLVNEGIGASGSLFFGGLRGEALYEVLLSGTDIVGFKTHFKNEFGRIRTVRVGPDNMLYITTSNTDGRGNVQEGDDKILRVDPRSLQEVTLQ